MNKRNAIEANQYQLFESNILEVSRMLGGLLKKLTAYGLQKG